MSGERDPRYCYGTVEHQWIECCETCGYERELQAGFSSAEMEEAEMRAARAVIMHFATETSDKTGRRFLCLGVEFPEDWLSDSRIRAIIEKARAEK